MFEPVINIEFSRENAKLAVADGDFVNRADEGGGSQSSDRLSAFPDFTNLPVCARHRFFQTRINQFNFIRSAHDLQSRSESASGDWQSRPTKIKSMR